MTSPSHVPLQAQQYGALKTQISRQGGYPHKTMEPFAGRPRSHRVGPSRSRARAWWTCLSSVSAIASRSVLGGGILAAKSLT